MKNKLLTVLLSLVLMLTLLFHAASLSYTASHDVPPEEYIALPIIMYHEVKHYRLGKDVISPWDFESDLKYLQKNNYTTITMNELIDFFHNGASLPENPVILSFDDGYLSNYKYVLPLLKKYNMKIVLSIIVKNTDDFSKIPDSNLDYSHVTWRQLNEMLATGLVEVQNHTYNMHKITNSRHGCLQRKGEPLSIYEGVFRNDVLRAQNKIYMMTGKLPNTFSYPYGSYCENTDMILKKLGFQATLSCRYGINILSRSSPAGLYRLKRLCRSHTQNIGKLLDEAYQPIRKKIPLKTCRLQ